MIRLFIVLLVVMGSAAEAVGAVRYDNPSWSPDGLRLVFESNRDGNTAVYTVNPDGADLFRLTDGTANDAQPAYSPGGSRIAFISDRNGLLETFLMNDDGGGVRRLSAGEREDYAPSWFPTGNLIAVMSRKRGHLGHDLVLIDLKTLKRATMTDSTTNDMDPQWSPDGKWILYRSSAMDPTARSWPELQKAVKHTEEVYLLDVVSGDRYAVTHAAGTARPVGWINDQTVVTVHAGEEDDVLRSTWIAHIAEGDSLPSEEIGRVPRGVVPRMLTVETEDYPLGSLVFARERDGVSGIYIRRHQTTVDVPVIVGPR